MDPGQGRLNILPVILETNECDSVNSHGACNAPELEELLDIETGFHSYELDELNIAQVPAELEETLADEDWLEQLVSQFVGDSKKS